MTAHQPKRHHDIEIIAVKSLNFVTATQQEGKGAAAAARKDTSVLDMLARRKLSARPAGPSAAAVQRSPAPAPSTAAQHDRRPSHNAEQGASQTQSDAGLRPKRLFGSQTDSEVEPRGIDGTMAGGTELSGSDGSGDECRAAEPQHEARRGVGVHRWKLDTEADQVDRDCGLHPHPDPGGLANGRLFGASQPEPDEVINLLTPPSRDDGDSQAESDGQQPIVIHSQDTVDVPPTPPEANARVQDGLVSAKMRRSAARKLGAPVSDMAARAAGSAFVDDPRCPAGRGDDAARSAARTGGCRDSVGVQSKTGSAAGRVLDSCLGGEKVARQLQNNISPASDIVVVLTPSPSSGSGQTAGSIGRSGAKISRTKLLTPPGSIFVDLTQDGDT